MWNKAKKVLSIFLCVLLVVTALPLTTEAAAVKLNKKSASVLVSQKVQLKVSGTKKTVKWSTSNRKVATVSQKGLVKGVKAGKATITAKVSGKKLTCKVTVKAGLNATKKTLAVGSKYQLKVYGAAKTIKWKSSDDKVATVTSKGKVTAKQAGTATIIATTGGKKYTCKVTVPGLSLTKKSIEEGKSFTLTAKNVGNSVKWSTSNSAVASIKKVSAVKYTVTGKKPGKATITAKVGKKKYTCKVTVTAKQTTKPATQTLSITGPTGTVYGYSDKVKEYLTTEDATVLNYYYYEEVVLGQEEKSLKDIEITWNCNIENVTKYVVEYATKSDYSDAISVETTKKKVSLRNLYKATTYYTRVTAYAGSKAVKSATGKFKTTDIGPRLMTVDGIYNVRDIGGYMTESGKRTLQGLIYRGSEMESTEKHGITITEAGKKTMSEVLKITHDMDLRASGSATIATSPIPGATKVHYAINGYGSAFENTYEETYRQIFSALANEKNYPVYVHCWGGADRTGTVCYLINALCGVSETDLIHDYEMTSWSVFGPRADGDKTYDFDILEAKLKAYKGDTLAEKTENYMLSIGVTATEIANIRAIMFGEPTMVVASSPSEFDAANETELAVTISGDGEIESVTLNGTNVPSSRTSTGITIKKEDMPSDLINGTKVEGKITFKDGKKAEFSFTYKYVPVYNLTDYMFSDTGTVTLDSTKSSVTSEKALGYGQVVRIDMQSTGAQSGYGGIYVLIGSYGVQLRGSEVRLVNTTDGINYSEVARETGMTFTSEFFETEGAYLLMSIDNSGECPVLYIKGICGNAVHGAYNYTFPSSGKLSSNKEIASADAKVTIAIQPSAVTKLEIKTGIK